MKFPESTNVLEKLDPGTIAKDVSRALTGDQESEKNLYQFLYEKFVRIFVAQGFERFAVEDSSQEAFISLLKALRSGHLSDISSVEKYLYSSIKYQLWHHRRKSIKYVAIDDVPHDIEGDTSIDGEELIHYIKLLEKTTTCISRLNTPRDKKILVSLFINEESPENVCRDLGVEKAHFYRILYRARRRLRSLCEFQS